jgi:hypothetical protein
MIPASFVMTGTQRALKTMKGVSFKVFGALALQREMADYR